MIFASKTLLFTLTVIGAVVPVNSAYAYIDPGTTGMVMQLLLGGIAGGAVLAKLYWVKVKSFFRIGPSRDKEASLSDSTESPEK